MQMGMFMMANGKKIKHMVMEYTHIQMVQGTKDTGKKINKQGKV
jgi:hypothetical protein